MFPRGRYRYKFLYACLPFRQRVGRSTSGTATREAVTLKVGWQQGTAEARQRLLADPVLFLRSLRALAAPEGIGEPFHLWLEALGTLAAVARRARLHLRQGALIPRRSPAEAQEASAALRQASSDCQALFLRSDQELTHA
jgi:hypothetical protein